MQAIEPLVENLPAVPCGGGVPPLESLRSALYGAVRYAESSLEGAGLRDLHLSRVICTPDARHWTLSFGEHHFGVAVFADGFSVRSLGLDA